ncbi:MAG TPA: HAD family hydrolase [Candidatus Kryptonia bacterium]|nr:HAD family hydrolase [Candidatus Kryptonia bacterium]
MNDLLLLFDIDGTLLHVAEEVAFARAFQDLYGDGVDVSWPEAVTASDTSFVAAVIARAVGRTATDAEVAAVLARFVAHLEHTVASGLTPIRPVAGAKEFVAHCATTAPIAIATGCVEPSARVKLRHAQLDEHFPCGGFSVRETRRADIVQRAIAAAEEYYGRRFAPADVVSFGDRSWDVEAARELGLRFVGVSQSQRGRDRLRRDGAAVVLSDFIDHAEIWNAIAALRGG